jgi:polysaccharide biosynthesis/export protein
MARYLNVSCLLACVCTGIYCHPRPLSDDTNSGLANPQSPSGVPAPHGTKPDYVLGPGDQIVLSVEGLDDEYNDKVFRIDGGGDVSFPLIGRIHAGGTTSASLELALEKKLEPVLKHPEVVVTVSGFGGQPVSVLGSVTNPGIVQLQGRKTLFDVLSMVGGLAPEAGYVVRITRPLESGTIPLPNATVDASAKISIASVRVKDIIGIPKESENIEILPGDTVSVPKAAVVYAVGSVVKPGGFSLDERESLSALQVVALAEGLQPAASLSNAKIIRVVPETQSRVEIPVNLGKLMAGKTADVQLKAEDILFVPSSKAKKAGMKMVDVVAIAAGYSVYLAH